MFLLKAVVWQLAGRYRGICICICMGLYIPLYFMKYHPITQKTCRSYIIIYSHDFRECSNRLIIGIILFLVKSALRFCGIHVFDGFILMFVGKIHGFHWFPGLAHSFWWLNHHVWCLNSFQVSRVESPLLFLYEGWFIGFPIMSFDHRQYIGWYNHVQPL